MAARLSTDGFDADRFDAIQHRAATAAQDLWQQPLSSYGGGR